MVGFLLVVDGREVLAATSGRLEQKERGLSAPFKLLQKSLKTKRIFDRS
jgi:hypothetical protein